MSGGPYTFGPFRLDPAERRVTRNGTQLDVSGRYLDALALLAAEDGRLVTKDRFMDEVWRGVPVTDEALTQCIRSLRKALGDDAANPRVIETVPRHGYRLLLPVEAAAADPVRAALPEDRTPALPLGEVASAGFGGAAAGVIAALGYLTLGLVAPRIGTASTLLVLLSTNLLLGLAGGAAIGGGIALTARHWPGILATALGGLLGGAIIGALGRMVGTDLFTLFFGQAPAEATGAFEGALLGLACGVAVGVARRWEAKPSAHVAALTIGVALAAGGLMALAGGRLMAGSLAGLAQRFPDNKLAFAPLGQAELALISAVEATLFVVGVVGAILAFGRLRR